MRRSLSLSSLYSFRVLAQFEKIRISRAKDTFLHFILYDAARRRDAQKLTAARVVATEMTRGQHSTFGRLTYPTSSFLRLSFLLFAFLPHLSRPTRRLARSLARARESFALIAPHAQGDEVTALFVCHPPATCFALSLNARIREEKRQRAEEGNGARTYDAMEGFHCVFDM